MSAGSNSAKGTSLHRKFFIISNFSNSLTYSLTYSQTCFYSLTYSDSLSRTS